MSATGVVPGHFPARPHIRPRPGYRAFAVVPAKSVTKPSPRHVTADTLTPRHSATSPSPRHATVTLWTDNRWECNTHKHRTMINMGGVDKECSMCQQNRIRSHLLNLQATGSSRSQSSARSQPVGLEAVIEVNDQSAMCQSQGNRAHHTQHKTSLDVDEHGTQQQEAKYCLNTPRSEPTYSRNGYVSNPLPRRLLSQLHLRGLHFISRPLQRVNQWDCVDRLMKPTVSSKSKISTRRILLDVYRSNNIRSKPSALETYMDSARL